MPAPITTRTISLMESSTMSFNLARIISETPFPFAFAQLCAALLYIYGCTLPFILSVFAPNPAFAGLLGAYLVF